MFRLQRFILTLLVSTATIKHGECFLLPSTTSSIDACFHQWIPTKNSAFNHGPLFPRVNHRQYLRISAITCGSSAQEISQKFSTSNVENEFNVKRGVSKSTDPEYPYQFTGRLWFSPALVKVPGEDEMKRSLTSKSINVLSLFGYTLGGTVTLEYDTSPVGPYREYVTMSSLVTKRASVGQWGSRLYVSTQEAEDVCKTVWGVPAEVANIDFREGVMDQSANSSHLKVTNLPCPDSPPQNVQNIQVEGWKNTRILNPDEYKNGEAKRFGNIPVLWTPSIKGK